MEGRLEIPELGGSRLASIRIPPELNVPVSKRVLAILDTPAVQRLKGISQLGLVRLVYPGAVHSRFEHSLGVYRLACLCLNHILESEPAYAEHLAPEQAKVFLLASLLHDVGHWPYCHPIEDLRLSEIPRHEDLAAEFISTGPLADVIREQWDVEPEVVARFIGSASGTSIDPVLQNLLNGPIDIDKMDYLQRDSLHSGVPYGRNFDIGRLISNLCIGSDQASIAITEKGKTAAEMMVFARYVMFSEVYWHHTVRSATAMLQRLVFDSQTEFSSHGWQAESDASFASCFLRAGADGSAARKLAERLFGERRSIYKRLAQYNFAEYPEVFAALARRPYPELVECSERVRERLNRRLTTPLQPAEILIDAPPVKLEVQFKLSVRHARKDGKQALPDMPLDHISPVVRSLATDQFDNFVKRVRVYVAPERAAEVRLSPHELADELLASLNS
jgi:HD superfamily phosphohydrolase